MKNINESFTNKAIFAAFVVLGAASAGAELAKTPITQTFEGEAEPVSVGYTVTGLGDFKNEVAVVFTNHTKTATWTVPQDLENVQFLVVGGGGGGGGGTWGPGGGGGGVVTGYVYQLKKDVAVDITVGAGGNGGTSNGAKGTVGGNSSIIVDEATYVLAYGGGASGTKANGVSGGSGSGGGACNQVFKAGGKANENEYDETVVFAVPFGNDGGANGSSQYCSGGGGGATGVGGSGSSQKGGAGGAGLKMDITGSLITYGSGGGGGGSSTKGSGGTNAGNGGSNSGNATSAKANCGGGGGGGGRNNTAETRKGGNGGSGIVVFRYATSGGTVDFAKIEEVAAQEYPYTGENQLVLNETSAYTVSYQNDNVPNAVGEYVATITLKDGFVWADPSEELSKTVVIKVVKSADEWVSEPSITKAAWSVGEAAGELTAPATKFNADLQVVISKKDDSAETFNSLENLGAGDYVVTWTAVATDNYIAAEGSKTVEFTVVAADAIPPYTLAIGEITETDRVLSVSYSLSCEASTSKTAEIIAVYTIEGSGETNEVSLAEGVALNGGAFTGTISDLKPGATYSVAVYSKIGEEKSELTEFKTVTVSGAPKDLKAEATFVTQPDKKFVVTGSVTPGVGETKVTLHYSLNSTDCDSTEEQVVDTDGAFSFNIPYENLTDTLSWYVTIANTFDTGTWQGSLDGGSTDTVTIERKEAAQSYYVWTGKGGDNLWTNPLNWDCDNNSCYGYPGVKGIYDYSWVGITSSPSAPIDLGGGTYEFIDNGAFTIEEGVTVEFYNGTLVVNGDKLMNGGAENTIGTAGSVMIFNNVELDHSTTLIINEGASVVFKGTTTQKWYYKPDTGSLIVRDGILTTRYTTKPASPASGSEVMISNGVWVVTGAADKGIASVVKFRDGGDRQAQLQLRNSSSGSTYYNIKLQGTYDIKIPATPYDTPYVLAKLLSANSTCTMKIDATDYRGDARVSLIQFKGTLDTATKTAMETMTTTADKLVVTADGEDVKAARNAKLVWDEAEKTLYFQQDSQNAASIGAVEYATLGEAVEAASDGATITVLNNCTADTACVIANKKITIDLNGKTVKSNDTDAAADGNGVFWVKSGGELTLEDSSEEKTGTVDGNGGNSYKMAIWADGGKVVINGGNYVNENDGTETQYDLIYVKNGGEIVINGGTFKCATPRWTLNSNNINKGTFVVTGGKFYQYNPTDFDTDEAVTTWCTEDYVATKGDDDYFTVVKKPTIQLTIDLGDGVSSVDYTIAGNKTTITEDTTIDIPESGTVVSFAVVAADGYFAPTVETVTVTETTTVTIAGVAFSAVNSADAAITDANRNAVYAWAKSNGKSQSEVSAANYLYADYLFNFTEFSTAEPTIEITEFTADPLVIKAKVTVNGITKIEDLSVTGLNINGTLKYKAAATLEALETATPKTMLEETDRFFKIVVE